MDRHRKLTTELPYTLRRNLLGYWPLASKGAVDLKSRYHSSAGAGDLTNVNTVTWATGPTNNLPDAAAFASASTQSLQRSSADGLFYPRGSFMVAGWAYLATTTGAQGFIAERDASGNIWTLRKGVTNLEMVVFDASNVAHTAGSTAPSATTWYFVVGFLDLRRGLCGLRINLGAEQTAACASLTSTGSGLYFGLNTGPGTAPLNGRLAHFGYWRRLLSERELQWLYNHARGRDLTRYL